MMIDMALQNNISELQKKAYLTLNTCMIEALKKGEMTVDESEKTSEEILINIDSLESFTELLLYLKSLSNEYPVYKRAYVQFKQEETQVKDKIKMEAIQAKLKQLTAMKN